MFLMCLVVVAKLNLAVCVGVDVSVQNNFGRALGFGDTPFEFKHVPPEHARVHHLENEYERYVWEWQGVVNSRDSFLNGLVVLLDFWDLFVG